jgi:hypothetical protein
MQCCGSGSARTRNFLQDADQEPELEVIDPDPVPELDLNLTKNHQRNHQIDNYNIKKHYSYIFIERDA